MSDAGERILIAAAHPDDEVLGIGGTVERHRADGDYVRLTLWYPCRVAAARHVESIPELYPDHVGLYTEKLERLIADWQPDIVYTHHGGDINADHRALHDAVMVACRPYAAPSVRSIRTFHTPSSTEWGSGFTPNLFVDISDHIEAKLAAMALYESELRPEPHPRSLEMLRARAAVWGSESGYRYAEAFQVERERW